MTPPAEKTCIYCGHSPMVPDPVHTHWQHCPVCNPQWAKQAETYLAFSMFQKFRAWAEDPRGRPTARPLTQ